MARQVGMSDDKGNSQNLPHADRKFYNIPIQQINNGQKKRGVRQNVDSAKLFRYIEGNVIGNDKIFSGPYGNRQVVYCDYTASGRSLGFIEDYIKEQVLPDYGNTHTTTTVTSLQSTLFRHEARDIIRNSVNASEHDAVIFAGSGCTAAVHKLMHALHLTEPPVVFVGPYEHHSNLLPWREKGAQVIRIPETDTGEVDLQNLEQELQSWQNSGRQLIGCFSAASNVTGIISDVDIISVILHRYGALVFWDYASAGPYMKIDMNPVITDDSQGLAYKDAVFISPHKFVGGVQTPGILVAKKKLFKNPVPSVCGGGSVFFVRREAHRYLQEAEMREEGGTPPIVESIRAGLVFQLKDAVTSEAIMQREHQLCRRAFEYWKDTPNLIILGSHTAPRLPIFSILIKHSGIGLFLHHNYVCAVLNDVFGIQTRGGCACAGPYAQDLLGISEDLATKIEDILVEDRRLDRVHLRRYREYSEREILRPGFSRINLPYFMNDECVEFVLDAVKMVAEHGWKLLPQYTFNPETGEWRHKQHQVFKDRKWLGYISYETGKMAYREPQFQSKGPLPSDLQDCLMQAENIFDNAGKVRINLADQTLMFDKQTSSIRWFVLPSEILIKSDTPISPPFVPKNYSEYVVNLINKQSDDSLLKILKTGSENGADGKLKKTENGFIAADVVECENFRVDACCEYENESKSSSENGSSFSEGMAVFLNTGFVESCPSGATADMDQKNSHKTSKQTTLNFEVCANDSSSFNKLSKNRTSSCLHESEEANKEVTGVMKSSTPHLSHAAPSVGGASVDGNDTSSWSTAQKSPPEGGSVTESSKMSQSNEDKNMDKADNTLLQLKELNGDGAIVAKETFVVSKEIQSTSVKSSGKDTKDDKSVNTGTQQRAAKSKGPCWHAPPKNIFKPTVEALEEHSMIQDGDRVLVCISGGKDSLSLLHTIRQYQFYARKKGISFEFSAMTVDPQTPSYDPSPLKGYLASLGVPYYYEEQCILDTAMNLPYECASICSFCSRMKRGRIYHCARREGYNVLALGQHLDDLAESFLMSIFHNGVLRTMKANYTVQEKDLRVIRPFVYVREKDLRDFAERQKLPVIPENCPACFEAPKERHRTKQLLAAQEILFPRLYNSIMSAIKPLMAIGRTGVNMKKILTQFSEMDTGDGEDEVEI
ncbi:uncharacterized protein LOC106159276 [Lingula anatina]|uniref:Uncharacterized protein LOC106159276 n=1 Tax=Lingula anatina TaxID=7574 RepID=A0A1S3HZF4_LINAN|nr:uncharacterized protein LOC106159276 [Lingula anatina]|eukprot:XP_013390956.1 uncharacterized protein LOC106159276 [Lingula anatina]